jgi:hypothetical protein
MTHWILFEPSFEPENQDKFKKLVSSYELLKPGQYPRYHYNTHTSKGILWSSLDNRPMGCTVYGKVDKFNCSDYYPKYSDCLLNQHYMLVDLQTFLNNKEFYFNALGKTAFVRPNTGDKAFTGSVISCNTSKHDLRRCIFEGMMDGLILLAPTQKIEEEYRFVIIDGKVITGSIYKIRKWDHLEFAEKEIKRGAVMEYAQDIVDDHWQPCKAYTMDVCLAGGKFKVVELNSFSHTGLHKSNIKKIVEAFS